MTSVSRSGLRCRQIVDSDANNVADLLARGFPAKNRLFWLRSLARLARHPTPHGSPRYGYVIENNGTLLGIVLLITSSIQTENTWIVRSNISCWYVVPEIRTLATLLVSRAVVHPQATYLNVSPDPRTLRSIEAQGFLRYSNGEFVAVPRFKKLNEDVKVFEVSDDCQPPFRCFERDLLVAHANYGCLSLWCSAADGAYPFVFVPRVVKRIIPCFQLAYCRKIEDYLRFARLLEWHFVWHRRPFLIIDSNGPIRGLRGKYFDGVHPKYFKGPHRPRLGDLAYTEIPMFGL